MAERDRNKRIVNRKWLKKFCSEVHNSEELCAAEKEFFGIDFSAPVEIDTPFQFDYGTNIHFSGKLFANVDCVFLDTADIFLGNNVLLGPRVQIYTAYHQMDYPSRRTGIYYMKNVVIGDDCWIGGGAIINPGVTLGNGCVVGSGSVVTKSFPDNSFIAGVPAKLIRTIDNSEQENQ